MNKNILLPISIIIAALFIGGAVLFLDNEKEGTQATPQNLRLLKLSVPNMVCAGCAASIEGYVKAMPGVEKASVSLLTKSGLFLYDPTKVTKEDIAKNTIFEIYPPLIVSDEPFDPSRQQFAESQTPPLPLPIQEKSNRVSQLIREKQSGGISKDIQSQLDEVNRLLSDGRNQEAEGLLDALITNLENL